MAPNFDELEEVAMDKKGQPKWLTNKQLEDVRQKGFVKCQKQCVCQKHQCSAKSIQIGSDDKDCFSGNSKSRATIFQGRSTDGDFLCCYKKEPAGHTVLYSTYGNLLTFIYLCIE